MPKKSTYSVSYRIIAFVDAESPEKAIEQIEDLYESHLQPGHEAFVSAHEEDEA